MNKLLFTSLIVGFFLAACSSGEIEVQTPNETAESSTLSPEEEESRLMAQLNEQIYSYDSLRSSGTVTDFEMCMTRVMHQFGSRPQHYERALQALIEGEDFEAAIKLKYKGDANEIRGDEEFANLRDTCYVTKAAGSEAFKKLVSSLTE